MKTGRLLYFIILNPEMVEPLLCGGFSSHLRPSHSEGCTFLPPPCRSYRTGLYDKIITDRMIVPSRAGNLENYFNREGTQERKKMFHDDAFSTLQMQVHKKYFVGNHFVEITCREAGFATGLCNRIIRTE